MWASVAASWGEHAGYVDARSAAVAQTMLDAAGLHHGERVLELACGPGGVGIVAAEIVGPDGAVVLSDFAPEMTAIAARRARGLGLTNVTTRELDLERIDYPDASFDVVLCRDGLMLVADPATAVREARRVCDRTGERSSPYGDRVNATLGWGSCSTPSPLRSGCRSPRRAFLGRSRSTPPARSKSCWCRQGSPTSPSDEVSVPMHAASFDEWWSVIPSLAGPLAQVLASLPAEVVATIRAGAETALAGFATPDGYELPGVSVVGVGRR